MYYEKHQLLTHFHSTTRCDWSNYWT